MMKCLALIFTTLLPCTAFAIADLDVLALEKAEKLFDEGEFEGARNIAQDLWDHSSLDHAEMQTRLDVLLCRVAFAFKSEQKLKIYFRHLYNINRRFKFDTFKDPPELHQAWTDFRIEEDKRLESDSIGARVRRHSKTGVAFFPFGVGHFDVEDYASAYKYAALDLFSWFLILSSSQTLRNLEEDKDRIDAQRIRAQSSARMVAGALIFAGSWSYQALHMMPHVYESNPDFPVDDARFVLSFAPMGAPQYKNGHVAKGLVLGALQAMSLFTLVATAGDSGGVGSSLAGFGFALSYSYSIYDGWYNHVPEYASDREESVSLTPVFDQNEKKAWGMGLQLGFKF